MSDPATIRPRPVAPVTARAFLFGEGRPAADRLGEQLHEHGVARSALHGVRALSASATRAVDREIGVVTDGLLDMDLGDALVAGWQRYTALTEAARRTWASPGGAEVVALATHTVTSTYRPTVDVYVDELKVNTVEVVLTARFDLTGAAAVVRAGDLVALEAGECQVTVTLDVEGARLAERKAALDPRLVLPLGVPVPLIDKAAAASGVPLPRAPAESERPSLADSDS
jgi:hypothetical protein